MLKFARILPLEVTQKYEEVCREQLDHLTVVMLQEGTERPNFDADHDRVLYLETGTCCVGTLDAVDFVRFIEEKHNQKRRWVLNVFVDKDIGGTLGWYLREELGMKREKVLIHHSFSEGIHKGLDADLQHYRMKEISSSLF